MKPNAQTWPRLTDSLNGQKAPNLCQSCGCAVDPNVVGRWLECDELDRPEYKVVVLCKQCADRLIEPHPRLYRELLPTEPFPGAMAVCVGCAHRSGVSCTSSLAQINGGPGLVYEPQGQMVHLCRSPRSKSGWHYLAPGPVTNCSGFEGVSK
jgi:hypothetical protein